MDCPYSHINPGSVVLHHSSHLRHLLPSFDLFMFWIIHSLLQFLQNAEHGKKVKFVPYHFCLALPAAQNLWPTSYPSPVHESAILRTSPKHVHLQNTYIFKRALLTYISPSQNPSLISNVITKTAVLGGEQLCWFHHHDITVTTLRNKAIGNRLGSLANGYCNLESVI